MASLATSSASRARVCKFFDRMMSFFLLECFQLNSCLDSNHFDKKFAVAGFRRLNRARIQLFRGDDHAMKESRIQLRAQFDANRSVPTSGPVFEELVKGMDEATHMLKHEIVRGDLNEDTGRYGRFHTLFSLL